MKIYFFTFWEAKKLLKQYQCVHYSKCHQKVLAVPDSNNASCWEIQCDSHMLAGLASWGDFILLTVSVTHGFAISFRSVSLE